MTRNDAPVGISANKQIHQLRRPFITAASVYNDAKAIVVIIEQSGSVGRGEASGVDYAGETRRPVDALGALTPSAKH